MNQMSFYAYHGVISEERRLGQRFLVSLELACDLREAGKNDDLRLTVDYGEVYNLTRDIVEGCTRKLLEAVAEEIATAILVRYSQIDSIRVKIEKPEAPIAGQFSSVGVQIVRSQIRGNNDNGNKPGYKKSE